MLCPIFGCCQKIDTTWDLINLSPTVTVDSSKGYIIKHVATKTAIDSSRWILFKIEPINGENIYNYFKIYGYGITNCTFYPPDSLKKWTAAMGDLEKVIQFGCIDYSIAYSEKAYKQTNFLLQGCKVTDTIPGTIDVYGDRHIREYRVGGDILGELVRTDIIDEPITVYFKNGDSLRLLEDNCIYFDKKPGKCYSVKADGKRQYYEWEVCKNLTSKYFSLKKE